MMKNQCCPSLASSIQTLENPAMAQQRQISSSYEEMVIRILEHRSPYILFEFIVQACDHLELPRRTKFLSRSVFDLTLTSLIQNPKSNNDKIGMSCVILASKINSNEQILHKAAVEEVFKSWTSEHQLEDLITELQTRMKSGSGSSKQKFDQNPYELVQTKISTLAIPSSSVATVKEGVETMIDLALCIPQLREYSCEDICEACWLTFLEVKMVNLSGLLPDNDPSDKVLQLKSYLLELMEEDE